jgi:nucleotide-binding universal stress UspA family protein
MVTQVLAPCAAKFPDVAARPTVVVGQPAGALAQASRGSALLVVGGRGRGGFTGRLLGSVSQAVLRHAYSPVAVAR